MKHRRLHQAPRPYGNTGGMGKAIIPVLLLLLATVSADDSTVMSALLAAIKPTPSSWSASTQYCSWTNVKCDTSNRVTSINLVSQSLTGTLPSDLNSLSQLRTLSLQKNSLSGALPSLANLNSLQEVYLDNNNFTSIPAGFLQGLTSLTILSLSENLNLQSWAIPAELSDSTNLVTFYADNSNTNGTLPDFLGTLPGLQNLRVSYNYLTGSLPASFAGSSIQNLWLNNQQGTGFSGTLDVLSSMPQLYQVWLQNNTFTGPIPDLSKCTNLFDLQLLDNELTGIVPTTLLSISTLQNVSLDNNKLQGPAPDNPRKITLTYDNNNFCNGNTLGPCDGQVTTLLEVAGALGYPTMLSDSWTGNDACGRWSYITCQGTNVIIVNLARQNFEGTISPAFANLTSLQKLLLNDNNLTGSIPSSLITLSQLQTLDVSNNNLSGPVPVFPATVKFTSTGNPFLGKNISESGGSGNTPGSSTNSTNGSGSSSRSSSTGLIIGGVFAAFFFVGLMSLVVYKFHYIIRCYKSSRVEKVKSGKEPGAMYGNFTISGETLRQATDNFSEDKILGRGSFGVVYKGVLPDETKIAVKRMELRVNGSKGMNGFEAEIAVLTKVRHKHLVHLLGYCIDGEERILVYEYMPKGTLSEHLFRWQERGIPALTWKQRVTIALDVARGVEYLHSLAHQSFIHRDLKPSNILLNDDMRAKVADFGLVRNPPDGKHSIQTRVAGTFGYLPPEYRTTGRVTAKVDVYAFGVILMELVTGRRALNESFSASDPDLEEIHLATWFRRVAINNEDVVKVVDQSLNLDEETMESVNKVVELASHCTADEPHQRPDMSHAVNILGPLVEQWKPCGRQEDEERCGTDLHMSCFSVSSSWTGSTISDPTPTQIQIE